MMDGETKQVAAGEGLAGEVVTTGEPAADGWQGEEIAGSDGRVIQRRQSKPGALTAARRRQFLCVLAATANVQRAAVVAGADSTSFYRLRARNPAFAAQWEDALAEAMVRLEGELLARALGEGAHGGDGRWESGTVRGTGVRVGGEQVVGARRGAIAGAAGGTVIDVEARAILGEVLAALRGHGLIAS